MRMSGLLDQSWVKCFMLSAAFIVSVNAAVSSNIKTSSFRVVGAMATGSLTHPSTECPDAEPDCDKTDWCPAHTQTHAYLYSSEDPVFQTDTVD